MLTKDASPQSVHLHIQVRSLFSSNSQKESLPLFIWKRKTGEEISSGHISITLLLNSNPSSSLLYWPHPASRNNSASQADYKGTPKSPQMGPPLPTTPGGTSSSSGGVNGGMPFKPVPPPKPKNYRPPMQNGMNDPHHPPPPQQQHWDSNGMVSGEDSIIGQFLIFVYFSGSRHSPISTD